MFHCGSIAVYSYERNTIRYWYLYSQMSHNLQSLYICSIKKQLNSNQWKKYSNRCDRLKLYHTSLPCCHGNAKKNNGNKLTLFSYVKTSARGFRDMCPCTDTSLTSSYRNLLGTSCARNTSWVLFFTDKHFCRSNLNHFGNYTLHVNSL